MSKEYNGLVGLQVVGEPMIAKLERLDDGVVSMEVLIPGVVDGDISVELKVDSASISLMNGSKYCPPFSIVMSNGNLEYMSSKINKSYGVLYVEIEESASELTEVKFSI